MTKTGQSWFLPLVERIAVLDAVNNGGVRCALLRARAGLENAAP